VNDNDGGCNGGEGKIKILTIADYRLLIAGFVPITKNIALCTLNFKNIAGSSPSSY